MVTAVLVVAALLVSGSCLTSAQAVLAPAAVQLPDPPTITGSSVGSSTMRATWTPPAVTGSAPVTGYRVSRDGTDLEGKGAWTTVVSADTRSFEMTLLRNDVTYTFSVAAVTGSGQGAAALVRLTPTAKPGAPVITASSAGDQTMTATWAPPTQAGASVVTGYLVARDGTDSEGKGPWSTTVPATQRTFSMTLLTNDVPYTFSVSAVNGAGAGAAATVRLTPRSAAQPPAPTTGVRPVVAQSAVGQPASLRMGGAAGPRLRMAGVSVWGVPDVVTSGGDFALNQYDQRVQIAAAVRAWGGNHIRLRVLADDYNNDRQGLTKARRLEMIKGWRDAATAAGLYFYVTWWDALDGYAEDANWPSRYTIAFAMMRDVYRTLGNDDHVFYEPFNEPNSFGDQWNAWSTAMRATLSLWRGMGYTGVLLVDTPVWSHAYDDASMTALERYDASLAGMAGKQQLVFARHDYANEGWPNGGQSFDPVKWRNDTGGAQQRHLIWESEFGNENGGSASTHLSWSQQASAFFADEFADAGRPNYVGATAFVWGPWWDGNSLTDGANNPTAWGQAVRDGFLRRAAPSRF